MRKFFWSFLEIIETTAIALLTVFVVRTFIVQPFLVAGASMEPNFHDGDYLLVDELSYYFREPSRGEVVVFRYPNNPKYYYIKRIIGLPGETIQIDKDKIKVTPVDGATRVLKESYLTPLKNLGEFNIRLGNDEYFVMGDNRSFSFDSRSWGPLKRNLIIGVVRARLWPINQAMAFTAPNY